MLHYYELNDKTSSKFWEISLENKTINTCYGKLNSAGKTTKKELLDASSAKKEFDKLVKEKTKKGYLLKEFPFPFFGAGYGNYYEWAEVCIRFQSQPNDEQLKKIIKLAPEPIKPSKNNLNGRFLLAGSEQFVNMWIEEAYGNGEKSDTKKIAPDEDDDDDDYNEDACFDVSEQAADAFEAHIEKWLQETHAICPIEFAYRMEDGEAGGATLSGWHRKSLEQIHYLITKWSNDDTTFKQSKKESELFKYALNGVFEFGDVKYETIPEKLIDTFFSEQKFKRLLQNEDLTEAITYFNEHKQEEECYNEIKEEIKRLIKIKKPEKTNQLISVFCDYVGDDYSFLISHVGELFYAAIKEKDVALTEKLIKKLSNKPIGGDSCSGDSATCDYVNNIGVFAYNLYHKDTWENVIKMYECALAIETAQPCTIHFQVYCNALWVLQNDNNGLPINKTLNEIFLAKCLPYGPQNPGIYFNAACLYVETLEFDKAFEFVKQAKKHNYNNYSDMMHQITKTEKMFSKFRKYPPFVEWFNNPENK